MTDFQWNSFQKFKNEFRVQCENWYAYSEELILLQKSAAKNDTPFYPIETPVVYNRALDELTKDSQIKLIVIGDNPGKQEQLSVNQKYLVGQAGKIADGFFRKNPSLEIDFRKNVIVLNKTPIHTAKTKHLAFLESELIKRKSKAANLIKESQSWMAKQTAKLHQNLIKGANKNSFIPELWLVGYGELKQNGIFFYYRNELAAAYKNLFDQNKVFVYQHFSMNRFSCDLKEYSLSHQNNNLKTNLVELGTLHKNQFFPELK